MAYVRFDDNGYRYYDDSNSLLFSSDNSHNFLFDFVDKDLSCLPELFEQYVSKRIDPETFDIKKNSNTYDDYNRIKDILKSAHPFYEHEYIRIIIDTIGNYFNNLLIYKHKIEIESDKWYIDRITLLIPPELLKKEDTSPNIFLNKYKELVDDQIHYLPHISTDNTIKVTATKMEESLIIDAPQQKPVMFADESNTPTAVSNMLYFLLDIAAQGIEELTATQRIWLYENIFCGTLPKTRIKKRLLSKSPSQEIKKTFDPLINLSGLDIGHDGIPTDQMDNFYSAVEQAKKVKKVKVYEEYDITSLHELLYLEVMNMVQSGTMIRKCKNCGRYFVVNNRKIAYCDRSTESGLPCSAVGSKNSFQKKMEEDEALKIYNRSYKTHFARVKSTKMSEKEFENWYKEAKAKLEKVRAGELSISDFQVWAKK